MVLIRPLTKAFAVADVGNAVRELVLGIGGLIIFFALSYWSLVNAQYALYALSTVVAGLFMVKVFTMQHDCGHESFLPTARGNKWVGRALSVITTMPFDAWRGEHAIHHSQVGDIDKVGPGDVYLLTVQEYKRKGFLDKLWYRTRRNAFFHIVVAPFLYFFVLSKVYNIWKREYVVSTLATDIVVLAVIVGCISVIGFWSFVLVYVPAAYIGGSIGVTLFFWQHNYPGVQWVRTTEWEHERGALTGSSLIVLPQPLEWLTHAIGYHPIHHLNSKIPGYRLRECWSALPLQDIAPLTLSDMAHSFRLKLWSFDQNRLVTFAEAEHIQA